MQVHEHFKVCHPVSLLYSPGIRKQIVKSFGQLLMYSSAGTRGVSKVILSAEHHIGQEITVGHGKADKETIKDG